MLIKTSVLLVVFIKAITTKLYKTYRIVNARKNKSL